MTQADSYKRAMVVVAHADDAEFGCSGTVAKWCRQGIEVVYVLCTDGSKGSSDPTMTSERLAQIRRQEQQAACKVLGVKEVVFLGYPDSMLQPTLELRRDITREIRRHKPDVLICQSPVRNLRGGGYIGHPDHLAAGEAAMSSVYPTARDPLTFPELLAAGFEPHKVRELLVMDREDADRWIDVTDTIEVAIEALKQHNSQIGQRQDRSFERLREGRRRAGAPREMKYAETFKQFSLAP